MEPREQVAQLYQQARDDVYRYAITIGLPPAQAQDLAQEVFLRLYEQLLEGKIIREPRAWIFRVAHNLALNIRKRESAADSYNEAAHVRPTNDPGVEEQLMGEQRSARVQAAVAGLSSQQRQVLELRSAGLRYREIAETMGIRVSTVFVFVSRAIERLRKALDD